MNLTDSVFERLLRERIIFLGQQVDDEIANKLCAQILLLSAERGVGFAILALLWLATMSLGVAAAVRRDFAAHRRWMLRCMALTTAAITLRIMLGVGAGALRLPFDAVYITAAWASWIVNLAVVEAWLRWPAWRARRGWKAPAPCRSARWWPRGWACRSCRSRRWTAITTRRA